MINQDMAEEGRDRALRVLSLLKHLFHNRFAAEAELAPAQKGTISPMRFVTWFSERMNLMNGSDECEKAQVSEETWSELVDLVMHGTLIPQIGHAWFSVILADRPKPVFPLESINICLLLKWADGTIMPNTLFAERRMLSGEAAFSDAAVAAVVANNAASLPGLVTVQSLDALHEKAAVTPFIAPGAAEDPYEVFMGLVLTNIDKLKPELRKPVHNYLRLFQSLVRPPIPPEVYVQVEAKKRQEAQPGRVLGGFDVG